MKFSQYLSVIIVMSGIWNLLNVPSSARSLSLALPAVKAAPLDRSVPSQPQVLARDSANATANLEIDKNLKLQGIVVKRNSSDNSLLTVSGTIENQSKQVHYVYYIVAKFVAKDISIKQAIIPINIDIEPGKSKSFAHEISTDSINSIAPETVKTSIVKYEYR
ncbi:hypothetical protein [Chamaesiphon sp. VAR_48_metabat_403]|uniref:hypothetical protein n=1 Tax=Chamaesiphon sp. VAR_48_metabat_403 TaxID=2964700 RepID=UPI00286E92DC|nr:hypothetical protein [Chamaesiphon sp. VAR_48_metabat_403]